MANPTIDVFLDPPDPGWKPLTETDLFSQINQRLRANFASDTNYIPYVISNTTPSVDDQDKVWIKLGPLGQPLGTFIFFGGNWRSTYTGRIGQLTMFTGDPSPYFDGTGLGLPGNIWDGWALANGLNTTTDLSDKFIIGAHMNNSFGVAGYSGGWQTAVTGTPVKTGGTNYVTLTADKIPTAAFPGLNVGLYTASGNAGSSTGDLYGTPGGGAGSTNLIPAVTAAPAGSGFFINPPFYAYALVQFIGY